MRPDRAGRMVLDALETAGPDIDELAQRLGLSSSVVADRYKRLSKAGIVRLRTEVHPSYSDRPAAVMVWGRPGVRTDDDAIDALGQEDGVEDVLVLASEAALTFRVRDKTPDDATAKANALAKQAGLEMWATAVVLRRVGERRVIA